MNTLATMLGPDDYIQEGVNPAPGVVILACTVGDDYDDPQNRILVLKDGNWLDFDLPATRSCRSMLRLEAPHTFWARTGRCCSSTG